MTQQTGDEKLAFEKDKWTQEYALREREVSVKEREVRKSRWSAASY